MKKIDILLKYLLSHRFDILLRALEISGCNYIEIYKIQKILFPNMKYENGTWINTNLNDKLRLYIDIEDNEIILRLKE